MRLRFWRRDELAVFDPDAGEIPEHLEVYPPGKPFPWRRMILAVTTSAVAVNAWDAYQDYRSRDSESGTLVVVEGAPLDRVCGEPQQLRSLYEAAPCDRESMANAGIDGMDGYYVAFAVRLRKDGDLSGRRPYLLRSDCVMEHPELLSPVDSCVVVSLE